MNPGFKDGDLQQAVDAVAANGNQSAAARACGVIDATFRKRYAAAVERGLKPQVQGLIGGEAAAPSDTHGVNKVTTQFDEYGKPIKQWVGLSVKDAKSRDMDGAPLAAPLPEGHLAKGYSTLYDGNGRITAQWVKTSADALKMQSAQEAALAALCEKLEPLAAIAPPMYADADLATVYTMTDCHVGMLAWDKETGADWDLSIAERCLTETLLTMIAAAPQSEVGILNQLGDFMHFDSLTPMTPTSHHILDADSRYQKVVQVAVRILRRVISAMLEKHQTVHVEMKEGNHDPTGSVWLRVMFAQLYADNPRVTVNMSPNPYTMFVWGKVLLGFYHGHLAKLAGLPLQYAAQFPEEWGKTEFRYVHTGHKHHVEEKEHPGMTVVQHPTLASPDAYAARGGWLSKRQATSMTYHRERGEFARGIFIPTK